MLDSLPSVIAAHWVALVLVAVVVLLIVSSAARRGAMAVLRVLAHPLLLLAVVALVYDGTRLLAGSTGPLTTSLIEHWQAIAPASLEGARAMVIRRLGPAAWDPVLLGILQLPAWAVLGGLGLAFSYIGRKRRTVNVFAN